MIFFSKCTIEAKRNNIFRVMARFFLILFLSMACLPIVGSDLHASSLPCAGEKDCFVFVVSALQNTQDLKATWQDQLQELLPLLDQTHGKSLWMARTKLYVGYQIREVLPEQARELLGEVLNVFPDLADYIRMWIGQSYLYSQHWEESVQVFEAFLSKEKDSLLRPEVLYFTAEGLSRQKACQQASKKLLQALDEDPSHKRAAWGISVLGDCAEQAGDTQKAFRFFRRLWINFPQSPEAQQIEAWFSRPNNKRFVLAPEDRYHRAVNLYEKGAHAKAIEAFEGLLSSKLPVAEVTEAQYRLARSYVRMKNYERAEPVLATLIKEDSTRSDDAWVWLGKLYFRQKKEEDLARLVSRDIPPKVTNNQRAQLFRYYGIFLEGQENWEKAHAMYQRGLQFAQGPKTRLTLLWHAGWLHYRRHEFAKAIENFHDIIGATNPRSTRMVEDHTRAAYWLGRSKAQLGQHKEAIRQFEELQTSFPFTYYGLLATFQLGEPVSVADSALRVAADAKRERSSTVLDLRHYRKAVQLAQSELISDAREELGYLYKHHGGSEKVLLPLISLSHRIGAFDIGIRLAIRHYGKDFRQGTVPSSSKMWAVAYPLPYQDVIQRYAPERLDPYLVSGLIREESLYQAQAVSRVGALGLMQLMPYTAKRVGKRLGLDPTFFVRQGLFEPEHNIQLGVHYLGTLLGQFQDNLIYSVAAYNAGPKAVQQWITKHGRHPAEEFVELIGYRETRGYVKRVIRSYRIYRMVFENSCTTPSLDRFC